MERHSSSPLVLIHANICGPMQDDSFGGRRYFLLLVDDCNKFMQVYFFKQKSEAYDNFLKFKRLVENQLEKKIKCLRTNNGGEFTSRDFSKLCEEESIRRELTPPYTLELNGIVERRNRTMMEMAQCMMKERYLPNFLWVDAMVIAVYLLNRVATKGVKGNTPLQALTRIKPTVKHLQVFKCIAYMMIDSHLHRTLDAKIQKVYFCRLLYFV